jgi:hypothetical protein
MEAENLWSEYNRVHQDGEQARAAVKGTFDAYRTVLLVSPLFLLVLHVLAQALQLEQLTTRAQNLDSAFRQARAYEDSLKKKLRAQEAWFARNEVVKFARNRRYDKTLLNFARAMAGLPEWGWFHSRRSCETIRDDTPPATPYLLFQTIEAVTHRMKPVTMTKLEKKLRNELLRADVDLFLRSYAATHWYYLQEAIQFCRGKDFKRADLPFKIMDRFLYHLDRPKTIAELELAKHNQLL